jgi:hypothetical protein
MSATQAEGKPPAGWLEPELATLTHDRTGAGQLRHPRYLGLRRDKAPSSVTREVAGR